MINQDIAVPPRKRKLKASIINFLTRRVAKKVRSTANNPLKAQNDTFQYLIKSAKDTDFGSDHNFKSIHSYQDWIKNVPVRDYEELQPYLNKIFLGQKNVLWPGQPIYFAFSSGTTSGYKKIPVTKPSLQCFFRAGRNMMSIYISETGNLSCLKGKILAFTHNITVDYIKGIPVQPIAGIAYQHTPWYVRRKFLPKDSTCRIENFEGKLQLIIEETINQNVTMIRGIPPRMLWYFNELTRQTGKAVKDSLPNLSLLVHGSVNIEPYRSNIEKSIGKKIDTVETYPASEGFIAFQDSQTEPGLMLNLDAGIFYEFILANEINDEKPKRISLQNVKLDTNYVIILNTNAGLWGYILGDTIRFVSITPYRILITGRTAHFLSTSGEHLIAEEVESALAEITETTDACITEFTVAPQIDNVSSLPYHEWYIEFDTLPLDIIEFSVDLNKKLGEKNIHYTEFCDAKIILPLQIKQVEKGGFDRYMQSIGKFGGQHKVPHLSNDRKIVDAL